MLRLGAALHRGCQCVVHRRIIPQPLYPLQTLLTFWTEDGKGVIIIGSTKEHRMEQERGSRMTANRALVVVAVLILVLLILASALVDEDMGSNTGGATLGGEEAGSQGPAPRDWVTLLIVPLALAGVGYVYTSYETLRAQAVEETRSQENRVSTFLGEMNKLIFEHDLRDSQPDSDVRRVARTRTLTVLLDMDSERKRRPLKAVYELGLVRRDHPLLSLDQADLDGAVLSEAVLPGIDLRGVYMREADLTGADLRGADLSLARMDEADLGRANLSGATVTQEQLNRVKSLKGTVMPDGSTHP